MIILKQGEFVKNRISLFYSILKCILPAMTIGLLGCKTSGIDRIALGNHVFLIERKEF
jgi:hypothetical protein